MIYYGKLNNDESANSFIACNRRAALRGGDARSAAIAAGGEGGNAEWSAAMLGNSRGARPLAMLAVLDRAARLLGTRFAQLGRFPMGRGHPQGAVTRLSRFSRIAPAKVRSSVASARTRSSGASEASGLECLVGVTADDFGWTLEIGKGEFGDGWDTVKILHRGLGVFAETVTQDAEGKKFIIRFR